MNEEEAKQQLDEYASYIRSTLGKTQEATDLIIMKGKELGIEVFEIENEEQVSSSKPFRF